MRRQEVTEALAAVLLAGACAEAAVRLLSPRHALPESVPVDLSEHFTPEQIARGAAYTRGQLKLGLAGGALQLGALLLETRRGRSGRGPAITAARLAAVSSLVSLPTRMRGRQRAIAAGLATQSWAGWARDQLKAQAIELPLAVGAGVTVARATERWPRRWWLPVSSGAVALGAVLAGAAPVVLDPLFNDFQPLEGPVREDVLALAGRGGIRLGGVMRMDASRRTSAANAYVSGWGPTRRLVLYDTLLDRYSAAEVRVVVAHELAHVRGRDVARGIAFSAIVAPAGGLAVQRLARLLAPAGGDGEPLALIALAAALLSPGLGLFAGRLSRAVERTADAVSLELSGDPQAFLGFERRIALQNLADVQPPWWERRLLATHPSVGERIGMAIGHAKKGPARAGPL